MKKIISTAASPKAIGPYSQAVQANGFIFVSWRLPIDPLNGGIVAGGISVRTEQVLANLKAIFAAAGSSLSIEFQDENYSQQRSGHTVARSDLVFSRKDGMAMRSLYG